MSTTDLRKFQSLIPPLFSLWWMSVSRPLTLICETGLRMKQQNAAADAHRLVISARKRHLGYVHFLFHVSICEKTSYFSPQQLDLRFDELQIWSRTAYLELILHLRYYIVERIYGGCYSAIIIQCKSSSRQWLNPFKIISFLFLPTKSLPDLKIPWEVGISVSLLLFPPLLLPAAKSYL